MAVVLVGTSGEPVDDLVEARLLPLPGRRAQRGIGGKEDALRLGNVGPLADLGQRDHILLAPADGGPVAARVLEQLVGLAEPERPLPSPEQLVEDDGGDLPALAAAGAVAQHPAAPEAHRVRQRLVVARAIVAAVGMRMNGVTIVVVVICRHRSRGRRGGRSPIRRRCGRARRGGARVPGRRGRRSRAGHRTGAPRSRSAWAAWDGTRAPGAAPPPWRRTAPAAWDARPRRGNRWCPPARARRGRRRARYRRILPAAGPASYSSSATGPQS